MKSKAHEAYKRWERQHTVNMQVHTNEQMFALGYDACEELNRDLFELVLDLEKENKRLDAVVKRLQKEAKNVKKV